jgi:asparagine synthase (glutamine-hydrolysing)
MCGIAGFLGRGGRVEENRDIALRMARRIRHRGPDGEGAWAGDDGLIALGHARLSIQDLSEHGAQPMQSSSGRYVISFNGEVYNFPSLAEQLKHSGHRFHGHSDTEVILAAIEEWGLPGAVARFVGMFAFALWDKDEKALHLVRDRLGIKPLYYRATDSVVVFASELKALREFDTNSLTVDRGSLASYLRHSYVPAPNTIYEGVRKLPPGSILTARLDANGDITSDIGSYWALENLVAGDSARFGGSYSEALDQLQGLLGDAVAQRMISDVPLGAFLSGGIDSSTVVALMQEHSSSAVKTFTIGFEESEYNEAEWAKKVAAHLQTDHTELYVSPEDARSVIPDLAAIYDEPFADSSQIPTILVSRLARQSVTVSLSGDGGDELFSGYKRYDLAASVWRNAGWMPAAMRLGLSRMLQGMSARQSVVLERMLDPVFRRFGGPGQTQDKMRKAALLLRANGREETYRHIRSHWKQPADLVIGVAQEAPSLLGDSPDWLRALPIHDFMMLADASDYLPDDILVKVDRASMSCGLEARVPLLDHRVVEFAYSLPLEYKRKNGQPKSILRDLLGRYVPADLVNRPKMGFGVPIDAWLRGPLEEWASALLSSSRLRSDGYLESEPILRKWNEHRSGERNWSAYLWDVLMFQAWLDEQK